MLKFIERKKKCNGLQMGAADSGLHVLSISSSPRLILARHSNPLLHRLLLFLLIASHSGDTARGLIGRTAMASPACSLASVYSRIAFALSSAVTACIKNFIADRGASQFALILLNNSFFSCCQHFLKPTLEAQLLANALQTLPNSIARDFGLDQTRRESDSLCAARIAPCSNDFLCVALD